MLRQGHLRNGASLRPNGPGESEVMESSECDKNMTCGKGSACNDKTFYEYLILGGKRKVELTTVEREEKRLAKNKRAKETRETKKKLLPSKSNMRSGEPSVNGQVALASSGQVDEKHDQAHAAVPFDIYGGTWSNTWEPMPDVYPI